MNHAISVSKNFMNVHQILVLVVHISSLFANHQDVHDAVQDNELRQVTDAFWEWKIRQFPEYATSEGFHQHDEKLESFTLETMDYRKSNCSLFLKLAKDIDKSRLTKDDSVTLSVLIDQLETFVNGYQWRMYGHLNPINFLEGIHRNMGWIKTAKLDTEEDYIKYIQRLEALPRQVKEIKKLMEEAISRNRANHKVSMRNVLSDLSAMTERSAQDTEYYRPFRDNIDYSILSKHSKHNLKSQGKEIIRESVQPALRDLRNFIQRNYLPRTRKTEGVSGFDNGYEYYKSLLHWHLSVHMDPMEVHNLGLSEVTIIKRKMESIMRALGVEGDLVALFNHIKDLDQFYNHTEAGILQRYEHIIHERVHPELNLYFGNITSIPKIRVEKMPHDGVTAQYSENTLMANTRRPHTKPSFHQMAIALHEANPGHHLQVSLAQALPIPKFRKYLWGGRKFSAPFHFPYYTAMVEGWGLYAEYLGEEMGMYENDYEMFGRYTFEMFRATRLVVDTGIHVLRWSRQKAIDYMLNHTFITPEEAATEIDRYITWPGQACAYKIGEIKIRKLRKMAEEKLGDKFDVKEFHWEVLSMGFVPLTLLEESINNWVDNTLMSSTSCLCLPSGLIVIVSLIGQTFIQ